MQPSGDVRRFEVVDQPSPPADRHCYSSEIPPPLAHNSMESDAEIKSWTRRTFLRGVWVLVGLYAPFTVLTLFVGNGFANPSVRAVTRWLTLPGFGLGVFAKPAFDDTGMFWVSGIATIAIAFALWRLSQRPYAAMVIATLLALSISIPTASLVWRIYLTSQ